MEQVAISASDLRRLESLFPKQDTGGGIVLCRPLGGLNDVLNQIAKCWRYSVTHRRALVIDFSVNPFAAALFSLLEPRDPSVIWVGTLATSELKSLDSMTIFPPQLFGRVSTYQARRKPGSHRSLRFDRQTLAPLTIDYAQTRPEAVVLHHSEGGGDQGRFALRLFSFTDAFSSEIRDTLSLMPENYASAHVRATDYRIDYHRLFRRVLFESRRKPVFVATDNFEVVSEVADRFNAGRVFFLAKDSVYSGRPLHRVIEEEDAELALREAKRVWLELAIVRASCALFFSSVGRSKRGNIKFSGFTRLLIEIAKEDANTESPFGNFRRADRFRAVYVDSATNVALRWLFRVKKDFQKAFGYLSVLRRISPDDGSAK